MSKTPSTVGEIMTETLVVLQEDESLDDLAENMERFRLRHLPVLAGDRLVGIVTHRDVLRAAVSLVQRGEAWAAPKVRDIMSRDPATVTADTPLAQVAEQLIATRQGCALVLDAAGGLAGIVTEHDFLVVAHTLLKA